MKKIELTRGYVALVDDEDFDRVNAHKWHVHFKSVGARPYAQHSYRENGVNHTIDMHRFILDSEIEVDHKDHNGLNCQRYNLRKATESQNQHNQPLRKNNTSGHKGVSWKKDAGKWQVRVMCDRKHIYIGMFTEYNVACEAADAAMLKYHGEYACV
jgi:hypothetical protein